MRELVQIYTFSDEPPNGVRRRFKFPTSSMPQHRTSSGTLERTRLRPPHSYLVIMHNDDETTMDFVVDVLMQIFRLNYQQSMKVMLKVHKEGQCTVAKYRSLDMAQTKVRRAVQAAEEAGFPLKFSIEPVVEE